MSWQTGRLREAIISKTKEGNIFHTSIEIPPQLLIMERVTGTSDPGPRSQPGRWRCCQMSLFLTSPYEEGRQYAYMDTSVDVAGVEERVQDITEAGTARERTARHRHWPWHESCSSLVSEQVVSHLISSVDGCNGDRRAKEKRLKKDAGRARWGQYFRWDQRSKIMSTHIDNWLGLFFQNQIISHCLIWKGKKFSFWYSLVSRGLKGPLSPGREKRAGKFESIIKSLWNNHHLSLTKMTLILRNR